MKSVFYQMPNTHSVTIGIYVRCGLHCEKDKKAGITHLLEHMYFRKLGDLAQADLYYKMESVGSTLIASTYRDFIKFTMKVAPVYLKTCWGIMENFFKITEWSDDEFVYEKRVVLNQICDRNEYIFIDDEARKLAFSGHPYSRNIMGDYISIQNITLKNLKKMQKNIFADNNVLVCITGCFEETDKKEIQMCLEGLNANRFVSKSLPVCMFPPGFGNRKKNIKFISMSGNRTEIELCFDIVFEKNSGMEWIKLLNCIVGEGVGSRLQKRLREYLGYTSDIVSEVEMYERFGIFCIRFSTDSKLVEKSLEEIVMILNDVKDNITKRDLDISLPFYTVNQIFDEDDTEKMNFKLAYESFILNRKTANDDMKNDNETRTRLQKEAQILFRNQNISAVFMGKINEFSKKNVWKILKRL